MNLLQSLMLSWVTFFSTCFFYGIYLLGKKMFQLGKHPFPNPTGQFHPSRSEVKLPMANGSPHGTTPQGSAVSKPLRSLGDLLQHKNLHGWLALHQRLIGLDWLDFTPHDSTSERLPGKQSFEDVSPVARIRWYGDIPTIVMLVFRGGSCSYPTLWNVKIIDSKSAGNFKDMLVLSGRVYIYPSCIGINIHKPWGTRAPRNHPLQPKKPEALSPDASFILKASKVSRKARRSWGINGYKLVFGGWVANPTRKKW